ncbi:MAG: T9SS type A sorting domain-containing protein [Bacteroidetes bacterium]|nr:T9SS type A sorting domain-containing protein [Bacteroidota bacterium]
MRILLKVFLLMLSMHYFNTLNAQPGSKGGLVIPYKVNGSPLFGNDIIINNQQTQSQQHVAVCSAFNGWLYAAITYKDPSYSNNAVVSVLISVDNGLSWTNIFEDWYPGGTGDAEYTSVDITTTGNSVSTLKFFLALVAKTTNSNFSSGFVDIHNGETGVYEGHLLAEGLCYDLAIASDVMYPALNSNPHSIGIVSSIHDFTGGDSIIFRSSSDGGVTLDNHQALAATGARFHKVDLAYGRSPSWSSGRYFATWEEQSEYGSIPGNIFTSHSDPNFDSPFTTPVNLDGLDPADFNLCMNPSIACQYNNSDNDSANFSEIVLFERDNQSNQSKDIRGYYNLQSANHTHFQKMSISNSGQNNFEPDISFNPYDSTFMLTYFDSTLQKLPLITHNFNLRNPSQWDINSTGYNDSSNLSRPYPKAKSTSNFHKGTYVWISNLNEGKGVAMFDATSGTWTGISENNSSSNRMLFRTFPNPCYRIINFEFELKKACNINIEIVNVFGQNVGSIRTRYCCEGINKVQYDVSGFSSGNYFYKFSSNDFYTTGRFTVIK